jgi:hypothetical protein
MNPESIKLDSMNLNFEYERISRNIDSLNNIDEVKNISKYFMKMYFLQQETISKIGKF